MTACEDSRCCRCSARVPYNSLSFLCNRPPPRVHSLPTPSSASVCWKTALELLEPALLETTERRRWLRGLHPVPWAGQVCGVTLTPELLEDWAEVILHEVLLDTKSLLSLSGPASPLLDWIFLESLFNESLIFCFKDCFQKTNLT